MATNQSLWDYYKTPNENNQQTSRINPFVAMQAQLMGQNAMQGNNRFLIGMLLGEWLKRYIAKMSDTKDPSPEGEVNADTISQMTQGYMNDQYGTAADQLSQATGYTPPTNLDSVTSKFKDPLGNAGEAHTWDSLKKQLDTNMQQPLNRQAPFFDKSPYQRRDQSPMFDITSKFGTDENADELIARLLAGQR